MSNEPPNSSLRSERELFLAALEMPAGEQARFVADQCRANPALQHRIELLLQEHVNAETFLEAPALARLVKNGVGNHGTALVATEFASAHAAPGERIGRYKLLQQIGEGGCGVVYMAEQEEPVRRRVALKIIKLGMDTKGVIARFEAERQALAMMDHPNIAKVFDAGATETGRPYFVMELVRGIKITEYADQNNLTTEDRLKLFNQVCQAIQHAHQKGIIHRDIKPSNILVTLHDGVPVPKVIDFGIAKATEQKLTEKTLFTQFQAFIGTPAYMSPEQAEMSGLDIDTRSDIYALGVLLYEILTGQTPFDPATLISKGIDECRRTIREEEPARPSNRLATMLAADLTTTASRRRTEGARLIHLLAGDLDWIVMKCLEKDRTLRYDTAIDLGADVLRYLNSEPVLARPHSNVYRLRKFLRKHRGPVAAAASIAAILVIGAGVSIWQAVRATKAEDVALILRDEAESAAADAVREKKAAHLNEYVADINLAQQSLRDGNLGKAVQLLEKHLPQSGEPDLRGFEWRYLWQISRGDVHEMLPDQDGAVRALATSPNGQWLVISVREQLHVWNLRTRTLVTTLTPKEGRLTGGGPRGGRPGGFSFAGFNSLLFSADGSTLFAASAGSVRSWKVADWSERKPLMDVFRPLALSRDGAWLALTKGGFMRREGVALLDAQTGQQQQLFAEAWAPFAFSPDQTQLASDSTNGITLWPVASTRQPLVLENSTNAFEGGIPGLNADNALAFSPDGRFLVAARNTASGSRGVFNVNIWDAHTGAELGTLPESPEQIEHTGVISALVFSPDGDTLATASLDHSVRLWNLEARKKIATLQGHLNEIWALTFSPDGRTLFTGAKDGSVKIWSTTREPRKDTIVGAVQPLAFSPDARTLAAVTREQDVVFLNLATGEPVRHFALDRARTNRMPEGMRGGGRPAPVALSADLRTLASSSREGMVKIWNTETGTTNSFKAGERSVESLALSPDGRFLVTTSREQMPRWWDLRAGTNQLWNTEADRVVFSPDGKLVAALKRNQSQPTRLWRVADLTELASLALDEPQESLAVTFSPDSRLLAITYADHTIGLWETASGKLLGICTGHKQPAFAVAFSADSRTLASAGADSTLRMWNVATQQELLVDRRLGAGLRDLLFSPDGQLLVGGAVEAQTNGVRVYQAPVVPDGVLRSARRTATAAIN